MRVVVLLAGLGAAMVIGMTDSVIGIRGVCVDVDVDEMSNRF